MKGTLAGEAEEPVLWLARSVMVIDMIGKGFVLLCLLGASAGSMALTAYSNLETDSAFNKTSGMVVAGSETSMFQRIALRFTSNESGALKSISVPVTVVDGKDNRLIVGLYSTSSDGFMGSLIKSWLVSNLPFGNDCYALTTITNDFGSSVSIAKGTSYWVCLMPDETTGGSDTLATWCFSKTDGDAFYAGSADGGITYGYLYTAGMSPRPGQTGLRVELGESSVPGPAAAIVFATGLAALRRRRSK